MNPLGNFETSISLFMVYIYECLKQLVFKCFGLSNGKDSTQQYLAHWPNFALQGGTQTFTRNQKIVLPQKINVL